MADIHPTAIVAPEAQLAEDVVVGPMCIVGPNVVIGAGSRLLAQCHIGGHTTIGKNNTFFPFCVIGLVGQDLHVDPNQVSYVRIGDGNVFRENCSVHSGTGDGTETVVGSNCMLMSGSHIAHNARIGNNVIMVNNSMIGGYCELGDSVVMSGLTALHQFCRVGKLGMMGGCSAYSMDVPPFMIASGRNVGVTMLNIVGMRRAGMSNEQIARVKAMYQIFFYSGLSQTNAIARIDSEMEKTPEVVEFLEFYKNSKRGLTRAAKPFESKD